jgi:hypothetical protein
VSRRLTGRSIDAETRSSSADGRERILKHRDCVAMERHGESSTEVQRAASMEKNDDVEQTGMGKASVKGMRSMCSR